MPPSTCPFSAPGHSHQTITLRVPGLTIEEFGLLQDTAAVELPDLDVRVEGRSDAIEAVLTGFRYQVLWAGYLLGVEIAKRVQLDHLLGIMSEKEV